MPRASKRRRAEPLGQQHAEPHFGAAAQRWRKPVAQRFEQSFLARAAADLPRVGQRGGEPGQLMIEHGAAHFER
jgi:hypothetical protein